MWPSSACTSALQTGGGGGGWGAFHIEALNAIKRETQGKEMRGGEGGRYFPNFFRLKLEISLAGEHILHRQLQG